MPAFDAVGADAVGGSSSVAASNDVSAPGALLTGTSSFVRGAASVSGVAGTAPGATLVGTSTFVGGIASVQAAGGTLTVPSLRTAAFSGSTRVIPFGTETTAQAVGPGAYWKNHQWWVDKVAADKLFYVADVSRDLSDSGTTAASVSAAVVVGATLLVAPVLQAGGLIVLKVGQLDTSPSGSNYITLRVTCADGEQFDRTIHFNVISDGSWTFVKDPEDQRFYALDMSNEIRLGGTTLLSASTPTVAGVSSLAAPVVQGNLAIVKVGGLDVSGAPNNSCTLPMTFANGEQVYRTIYFTRQDN